MGAVKETVFTVVGENCEFGESDTHYIMRIPKTAQGRPSHGPNGQPGKSLTIATTPGKFGYGVPGLERTSITLRMSKWNG